MIGWINRMLGRRASPANARPASAPASTSGEAPSAAMVDDFRLARKLYAENRLEAAAERFELLVGRKHDWADAHRWLGVCRLSQGRHEDARDAFVMALHFEPDSAQARYGLALAEEALGRPDDALRTLDVLLEAREDHADALNMRGVLRLARNDVSGARADFERALAAEADHVKAHNNLGHVLFCDLGEYESGAQHIERALELDPEHRAVQCNLALLLSHRGDDAAALALCDRLLSENAALHEVRLHRALTRLRHAQFDAGWDDYEARRQVRSSYARRGLPWPEWKGDDLSERTILLFGEQGLGDEVMFASCFGDVIARAKHTVIECSPRLHALFRRSFPVATVLPGLQTKAAPVWLPEAPQIDVQSPAGSLPRHFRRSWHDFPRHRGYLVADGERVRHWSGLLSLLGAGPKIGVSWRGGLRSTRGALRSLGPGQLESLFAIQGVHFVDLQYGDTLRERTELAARGMALASWPEAIEDLDETAALISSLDLVVTVCTTVAHLAGALGKDVWVLVPSVPEWRYLAQGERMPWYPSARLFRQGPAESWGAVVGRVAAALRERVAGGDGEADDS